MLFATLPQQVWAVLMLLVSVYALLKGGAPERIVAVANVIAWLASPLAENVGDWADPQWGLLAVDAAFLAVLLALAMTTDRTWLLWASAFQLLAVATHAAMMADRSVGAWAYITAGVIWSYLVLASLAAGTWLQQRWRQGEERRSAYARSTAA
jgi:hypothetical protein